PDRQVFESLPLARAVTLTSLVAACGLSTPQVMAALGRLERSGRVQLTGGRWRRAPARHI
ncbi:MAG: hypothetical protein LBO75_02885, partial [Bifidobacteriaceae bacterium]|nr:hypothetical protein [Bifidobacteriaceae bacterium]